MQDPSLEKFFGHEVQGQLVQRFSGGDTLLIPPLESVVLGQEFFLELGEDETVNANPKVKAGLAKAEGLDERFEAYVGGLAGGPGEDSRKRIEAGLGRLGITEKEWKAALAVLGASMEAVGIAKADREELLRILAERGADILATDGAPK